MVSFPVYPNENGNVSLFVPRRIECQRLKSATFFLKSLRRLGRRRTPRRSAPRNAFKSLYVLLDGQRSDRRDPGNHDVMNHLHVRSPFQGFDGAVRVQTEILGCGPGALPQKHVPVLPELRGTRSSRHRVREGGKGSHPDLSGYGGWNLSLHAPNQGKKKKKKFSRVLTVCVCVRSDPSAWYGLQSEQQQ